MTFDTIENFIDVIECDAPEVVLCGSAAARMWAVIHNRDHNPAGQNGGFPLADRVPSEMRGVKYAGGPMDNCAAGRRWELTFA